MAEQAATKRAKHYRDTYSLLKCDCDENSSSRKFNDFIIAPKMLV
jgi:hypothetical protein